MLRTWRPDETNYFSLLPIDVRHFVHDMMIRDLTTQIIGILYKPYNNWHDEYGNTEDWYAEILKREIEPIFERHSISIKLDYKQAVGVVSITLQDHVAILDQMIIDLILLRKRFNSSNDGPLLNTLLWR